MGGEGFKTAGQMPFPPPSLRRPRRQQRRPTPIGEERTTGQRKAGQRSKMSRDTQNSRAHSSRPAKKTKSSRKRASAKPSTTEADILCPAAMENVYYISHNAVDCLEFRGFGWPESSQKTAKKQKKHAK